MQALRNLVGGERSNGAANDEEAGWWDELNSEMTLSKTQRLYGFIFCAGLGLLCSFLSVMFLSTILIKPTKFAVANTLGNVLSIGSTAFLVGPKKQFKTMFKPVRAVAAAIYLSALVATLLVAIYVRTAVLVLLMILIQYAAYIWYCASYIPYARTMLRSCFSATLPI